MSSRPAQNHGEKVCVIFDAIKGNIEAWKFYKQSAATFPNEKDTIIAAWKRAIPLFMNRRRY